MEHFGLICPPGYSHVTGLTAIARQLCRRGHRATAFNILDVESLAHDEGVEFKALGSDKCPKGSFEEFSKKYSQLQGFDALRFGMRAAVDEITMLLEEAPEAIKQAGVTALLVDQGQPAGSTIAERAGIPFITVANAVPDDPDPDVPPALTNWFPPTSSLGRLRIRFMYKFFDVLAISMRKKINRYRKSWSMPPLRSLYHTFSPLLELAQQSDDFDFPRRTPPKHFHHIGLLHRPGLSNVSFPFEKLDRRPLVYVTMGTVVGDARGIFRIVADACVALKAQVLITLGGRANPADYVNLPGSPIVVSFAPQLEILKYAAVTVCHSGNNTVLESLAAGVPAIAMPTGTDQYGVAARLVYAGAGERLQVNEVSTSRLQSAIGRILSNSSYRQRAKTQGDSIRRAGGEIRAAELIEKALGIC